MSNWREVLQKTYITRAQVDASLQCSICLEDHRWKEEVRKLDCLHYFHEACIAPWLDRNNFCPTCRRQAVNNVCLTPPPDDLTEEVMVEFEGNFGGDGSEISSDHFESESEESYTEDVFVMEPMSDHSEEESYDVEDLDIDEASDLLEMEEDDSLSEINIFEPGSDNTMFVPEATDSENGSLPEESVSDDYNFDEVETGSVSFSDDNDHEQ